jgi:hypothetical protein
VQRRAGTLAATRIQSVSRGFLVRMALKHLPEFLLRGPSLPRPVRPALGRGLLAHVWRAATRIQSVSRGFLVRNKGLEHAAATSHVWRAATRIQSVSRGFLVRNKALKHAAAATAVFTSPFESHPSGLSHVDLDCVRRHRRSRRKKKRCRCCNCRRRRWMRRTETAITIQTWFREQLARGAVREEETISERARELGDVQRSLAAARAAQDRDRMVPLFYREQALLREMRKPGGAI